MATKSRESAGKGQWSGLLFVASLLLVSVSGSDAQAQEAQEFLMHAAKDLQADAVMQRSDLSLAPMRRSRAGWRQ
jgi:hypothetical protein